MALLKRDFQVVWTVLPVSVALTGHTAPKQAAQATKEKTESVFNTA